MADLKAKREGIVAEHKAIEKHDPHHRAEAEKVRAAGRPTLSERPIAFQCDDEVVVVGECVGVVVAAAAKFVGRADEYEERAKFEPVVAMALKVCRRVAESSVATSELRLTQQHWNCLMFGLTEVGVQCVLTDGMV